MRYRITSSISIGITNKFINCNSSMNKLTNYNSSDNKLTDCNNGINKLMAYTCETAKFYFLCLCVQYVVVLAWLLTSVLLNLSIIASVLFNLSIVALVSINLLHTNEQLSLIVLIRLFSVVNVFVCCMFIGSELAIMN